MATYSSSTLISYCQKINAQVDHSVLENIQSFLVKKSFLTWPLDDASIDYWVNRRYKDILAEKKWIVLCFVNKCWLIPLNFLKDGWDKDHSNEKRKMFRCLICNAKFVDRSAFHPHFLNAECCLISIFVNDPTSTEIADPSVGIFKKIEDEEEYEEE